MAMRPIDTLLAIKVVGLIEGLNTSDRRVAVLLLEHFNRKTTRCDPGLARIAGLLGICERTVIRSVQRLERVGLFHKVRHGGYGNRNSYKPVWSRFEPYEGSWREKLTRKANSRGAPLSPETRQPCHVEDDSDVTQTYRIKNLHQETCVKGLPKEEKRENPRAASRGALFGNRSVDAAKAEAERRWTNDLHKQFCKMPITYGEVIDAITLEIQLAATDAELRRRGGGLAHIFRQLRLGPPR
jgi:predicted transcriptional regulator